MKRQETTLGSHGADRRGLGAVTVACLAMLVVPAGALGQAPEFEDAPAGPEDTGSGTESITAGDFNADGVPDLAVPSSGDAKVTILLGDGTGDFVPPPTGSEQVAGTPKQVAVGDFDGDANQDLAVAQDGGGKVAILLGNGTGDFTQPLPSVAAGNGPRSVAVGDFDGDGDDDIAAAATTDSKVNLLIGDGAGGFALGGAITTGGGPVHVAVAELNGDADPDLAVANHAIGADSVTVAFGAGEGAGFSTPQTLAAGTQPWAVATADFTGDGAEDLAVTNFASDDVSMLAGDGAGAFAATPSSPRAVGDGPRSPAVADLDLDGSPDLAVPSQFDGDVTVLLDSETLTVPASTGARGVAAADFNGDGRPDLAVANGGADTVTILLNRAPDTTPPNTSITAGPAALTRDSTPTFRFSSTEAGSRFQCRIDGAAYGRCSGPGASHTAARLANGRHTFQVRARDGSGNLDPTPARRSFTVDTRRPQTTITQHPPLSTKARTARFSFKASEVATFRCKLDGKALAACSSPKTYRRLKPGKHTFSVVAVDRAKNADASPAIWRWTVKRR